MTTTLEEKQAILGQALIAFGQGTGAVRVSRATVRAFHEHFGVMLRDEVVADWQEVAPQALERVRAMGRLAALTATQAAKTIVEPRDLIDAASSVAAASSTSICSDDQPAVIGEAVAAAAVGLAGKTNVMAH